MERSFQSTKPLSPKFLGGASYVGLDFLGRMKEGNEKEGLRGGKKGGEKEGTSQCGCIRARMNAQRKIFYR